MLRYVGGGSFIPGIPARDLTEAEIKAGAAGGTGGWDRKALVASGVYEEVAKEQRSKGAEGQESRGVEGQGSKGNK